MATNSIKVECKHCNEFTPLKWYLDGRLMHFDGLMSWSECPRIAAHDKQIADEAYQRGVKDGIESVARSRTNNE